MPSLQSHFIYFILRNRHLLHFRLKREAWDWNTSITAFRQSTEAGAARVGRLPEGILVTQLSVPGLPPGLSAEWIRLSGSHNPGVIFYTHGGGYVSGSCTDHRAVVAKLVKGSGAAALLFEYRLAPEHPYPAAIEDTLTVYRWLLGQPYEPSRVVIAGESAGGGLGLSAMLAMRDNGLPLPAAAVAISPWTDLTCNGESHRTKLNVCISPPGMAVVCSKYYAGELDPALPLISPLFGDLAGLPPLLIYAGDYETMLDDSLRFAAQAGAAGVRVTLRVGKGMVHCYPLLAPLFPEASHALAEICTFINEYSDRPQSSVEI
jgi:monoterpene epsilon-lactone hydrolase